jgi:hypothetical protein
VKITALVEALVAAGATPEMILAAVRTTESANEAALEQSREKTRARVAKWRATKAGNVTDGHVTRSNILVRGDARVEDKTSNQEIEPQEKKESALTREFVEFWTAFPNKVGKPKAKAAFGPARKRASFDEIMAGLRRYVATKPADRAWMNPQTFLNGDRWGDQPAPVVVPMARGSPPRNGMMNLLRETRKEAYERTIDADDGSALRNVPALVGGRNA